MTFSFRELVDKLIVTITNDYNKNIYEMWLFIFKQQEITLHDFFVGH